jgi:hypothetical protein
MALEKIPHVETVNHARMPNKPKSTAPRPASEPSSLKKRERAATISNKRAAELG